MNLEKNMSSFKKSTIEQVQKIRELYKQGCKISEISREVGKDRSSVYYWIKRGTMPIISKKKKEKDNELKSKNQIKTIGRLKKRIKTLEKKLSNTYFDKITALENKVKKLPYENRASFDETLTRMWLKHDKLNEMIIELEEDIRDYKGRQN